MNAFYQMFTDVPDTDYKNAVGLEKELASELTDAYQELFDDVDVRHFNDTVRRLYTIFLTVHRTGATIPMDVRKGRFRVWEIGAEYFSNKS